LEIVAEVEAMDLGVAVIQREVINVETRVHVIPLIVARQIICLIAVGTSLKNLSRLRLLIRLSPATLTFSTVAPTVQISQ